MLPVEQKERRADQGPLKANANGTFTIIEEPAPETSGITSGGLNFLELYGLNDEGQVSGPHHFSQEAVECLYFDGGTPEQGAPLSEAGKELYSSIKTHFIDSVPHCPYGSPSLYFTGGIPGSGKGHILKTMMGKQTQFVLVDPDEIKQMVLQDFAGRNPHLVSAMEKTPGWNGMIHESASALAKNLMEDALASGKDVVFDSSMASGNLEKYRKYAQKARAGGYKIYGIIAGVSEKTAQERAVQRAKKSVVIELPGGETLRLPGRLLQPQYIHDCALHLESNLHTYLEEGLFDRCVIFDNNNPVPTVLSEHERMEKPDGTFTSTTSLQADEKG